MGHPDDRSGQTIENLASIGIRTEAQAVARIRNLERRGEEDRGRRDQQITALEREVAELREAAMDYMSAFGQALEAYGIPLGEQQRQADERIRAALNPAHAQVHGQDDRSPEGTNRRGC